MKSEGIQEASVVFVTFLSFFVNWALNSGLCAWKAGAQPFEPGPQPFLLWLFWRQGLTFCPGHPGPWSSYFKLPLVAGIQTHATMPSFFPLRWGLTNLFLLPELAWNPNPPDLRLLHRWNDRHMVGLRWWGVLWNYFPRLVSNSDPSDLSFPSS
jgi:hypothetical protein